MRTFERTHPWISFRLDMRLASPELWLLLGEAASKCEHIARVPLRPATAQQLHMVYLAKGVAATTAIEGNTLQEAEVLKAVEGTLEVSVSRQYLKQEVDNVIAACNRIGERIARNEPTPVTPSAIAEYNALILERLPTDEGVVPGRVRQHSVVVGNVYRGAPAEDCHFLLEHLCLWLNGKDFEPRDGMEIVSGIIKAIVAHLYLAWIHPFGDGNGRTARLLEFDILLTAGVPSPAAHLLSNHYNQTRSEYYRQLDRASKSGGDVLPFLTYSVRGFVDGLRGQLEYIWDQQWDVVWRNYVHERFQNKNTQTDVRQRHLALDLRPEAWVDVARIAEVSPRLAKAYATKTPKTVQRDVASLIKLGLLERRGRQVRTRREVVLAFLPLRRNASSATATSSAALAPSNVAGEE